VPLATGAGCKSAGQVAAAAITVGAAVAAAAINRAATKDCWGRCGGGMMCDRRSGMCVPIDELLGRSENANGRWYSCDPDRFVCEPDDWLVCDEVGCDWFRCNATGDACEPRQASQCPGDPACPVAADSPGDADPKPRDPCRGLCFSAEVCVVNDGVADCVRSEPAVTPSQ